MVNRREFLEGAVAATALPLITGGAMASLAGISALPLYKVIFDQRFPAARAFAEAMTAAGTPVHAISGDVTSVWYNDLHYRWLKDASIVGGLTAPSALFCLERLAWDYKRRVVFLAEHRSGPGGLQHNLLTPGEDIRTADLDRAGARWTDRIAAAMTRTRPPSSNASPSSIGLPRSVDDTATTLVSWIIAPAARPLA